jgi:pyruvate formate lyase activating enzyme
MRGTIFDIKRFAVHDGPGIRTTIFFKGCPLHCLWCHNPEGIDSGVELMVRSARCSENCVACLKSGPKGAISKIGGRVAIDRSRCDADNYASAAEACLYDALQLVGRKVTADELVTEVEKDRVFYEQSGGGVTFSGGEPLLQHRFLSGLIDALRARGFRTALDTSGYSEWDVLEKIAGKVDLVLYDLKLMDEAKHMKYTGVSNRRILENLRRLSTLGGEIWVRIPLVPGVNDDDGNIRATAGFLKPLKNIARVSLLSYHKGGCAKAGNLGKGGDLRAFETLSPVRAEAIEKSLSGGEYEVRQGG